MASEKTSLKVLWNDDLMAQAERLAIWAGLFAGLAFGLFWIPIRAIETAGFAGPWAAALFTGVPMVAGLAGLISERRSIAGASTLGLLAGVLGGLAFALYSAAFLYTDVVRAILLFYMTPIWGFLLGWAILKDLITPSRWLAIALGLLGMGIILGVEAGLPMPRNLGDWMALGGGLVWAFASVLFLREQSVRPLTHVSIFFIASGSIMLVSAVLASTMGLVPLPDPSALWSTLLWVVPVTIALTLPAGYATVYAPTKLNPGVVGLLFMVEISVATLTAALLTDEPLGLREITGVLLVISAGLLEPAVILIRSRPPNVLQDRYSCASLTPNRTKGDH